jgi:hypothetical protein
MHRNDPIYGRARSPRLSLGLVPYSDDFPQMGTRLPYLRDAHGIRRVLQ